MNEKQKHKLEHYSISEITPLKMQHEKYKEWI